MLLGKLGRIKLSVERQKYSSKERYTYIWNFFCLFFHIPLNTLDTSVVWYVSMCGYVSHDSIVWHEVLKSVQKDRKLFAMQIAHEAHPIHEAHKAHTILLPFFNTILYNLVINSYICN